jgi:hypothetical protein
MIIKPEARIGRRFSVSLEYVRNEIELPTGSFVTDEVGGRMKYGFSPRLTSSLFAQWNNEDRAVNVNFRLHWIPEIGSDAYLVVNQVFDANGKIDPARTTIIAKIAYLFIL